MEACRSEEGVGAKAFETEEKEKKRGKEKRNMQSVCFLLLSLFISIFIAPSCGVLLHTNNATIELDSLFTTVGTLPGMHAKEGE